MEILNLSKLGLVKILHYTQLFQTKTYLLVSASKLSR